jgi:superfamily II DNA or RNA helicase
MQSAQLMLQQHDVYKKCESLWNKKRDQYLKQLLAQPSTGSLMIYKVDADLRTRMLREKQVTFAIAKYGREGLDERSLDTIIVNEPLSSRNSLQQLMGRVLRKKEGKKEPVVVILEDDIGPFIGMCRKLRCHLSEWPHEEGGPFVYENRGHITTNRTTQIWTSTNTRLTSRGLG